MSDSMLITSRGFHWETRMEVLMGPMIRRLASKTFSVQTGGVFDCLSGTVLRHPAELMVNHFYPTASLATTVTRGDER